MKLILAENFNCKCWAVFLNMFLVFTINFEDRYFMVDVIKELVDECRALDIIHPELGVDSPKESKFNFVAVYPGIILKKNKSYSVKN